MARIEAPNKGYSGPGPGGVVFENGVADTDNEAAISYFRSAGYTVDGEGPPPGGGEPPDPRQQELNVVGTPLRDAAVDPEPGDFLPPINAGQGNPHGPAVISPEIHASGPKGIVPGGVPVDDHGKQQAREQAYAGVVLADRVDATEAVATVVPDQSARGGLGLSDPGSADAGAEAAEEPPEDDGDAEPVTETSPPAPDDQPAVDEPLERPQNSDLKEEWVEYAVSQGAQRIEAESMTKAQIIERFGA